MYLLSQRVVSQAGEERGINSFVHLHDDSTSDDIEWETVDIERIATLNPGRLVHRKEPVFPRSNLVLSYLEIAGPDTTAPDRIQDVLAQCEAGLGSDTAFDRSVGDLTVRFRLVLRPPGFDGLAAREFSSLRQQMEDVFREWFDERPSLQSPEPLVVWRETDDERSMFTLDSESRRRVQEALTPDADWSPYPVTIEHGTRQEFESNYGNLLPNIIPVVVGMTLAKVAALGGVKLCDKHTEQVLTIWPENRLTAAT